jgi:hypothetical protein
LRFAAGLLASECLHGLNGSRAGGWKERRNQARDYQEQGQEQEAASLFLRFRINGHDGELARGHGEHKTG